MENFNVIVLYIPFSNVVSLTAFFFSYGFVCWIYISFTFVSACAANVFEMVSNFLFQRNKKISTIRLNEIIKTKECVYGNSFQENCVYLFPFSHLSLGKKLNN